MSTNMPKHEETSLLTIAKIRKGPKGEDLYLFNERQRIYTLSEQAAATAPSRHTQVAPAVALRQACQQVPPVPRVQRACGAMTTTRRQRTPSPGGSDAEHQY